MPTDFHDDLLSERVDLLRRRRADGTPESPGAAPAPGGWLAMGNGEILPGVTASLRKHSPSLFQKEG